MTPSKQMIAHYVNFCLKLVLSKHASFVTDSMLVNIVWTLTAFYGRFCVGKHIEPHSCR